MAFLFFRLVKLSSPNLNYFIVIGASLLFISVYLYNYTVGSLNQTVLQSVVCNVRQVVLCADNEMSLCALFIDSTMVFIHWLHSVFCCDSFKDLENLLHFQQSIEKEEGSGYMHLIRIDLISFFLRLDTP